MLFFCLACESVAMKDTNAKCLPLIILFMLVCFEIMTSFVCLIPSNNYSLLSHSLIVASLYTCVCMHVCLPTCPLSCTVCVCPSELCTTCAFVSHSQGREQTAKATDVLPYERNFIVNGAQKCTCLQATQGFGISHCVLAPVRHL